MKDEHGYEYTNHGPFRVKLEESALGQIMQPSSYEELENICNEIDNDPKFDKVRAQILEAIKNVKFISLQDAQNQIESFNK